MFFARAAAFVVMESYGEKRTRGGGLLPFRWCIMLMVYVSRRLLVLGVKIGEDESVRGGSRAFFSKPVGVVAVAAQHDASPCQMTSYFVYAEGREWEGRGVCAVVSSCLLIYAQILCMLLTSPEECGKGWRQ